MSHPTWGDCTVGGAYWDCGSVAGAGYPLLETCYLPHKKSHWFRTIWIDRKLGLWGGIQNTKWPGWGGVLHGGSWAGGVCRFRGNPRTLVYQSNAFPIVRGRAISRLAAVARLELVIPGYHGRGSYGARLPAPYGRPAVPVVTARRAATGAASGFYVATAGSVSIVRERSGFLAGTVYARLRLQGGTKQASLNGSWSCHIEPSARGS
jgi:hypothetical protein